MLAILYTEDKSLELTDRAVKVAAKFFQGFTLHKAQGYWQGKPEASLVFHFIGGDGDRHGFKSEVKSLAYALRALLGQEAVLVWFSDNETFLAERFKP